MQKTEEKHFLLGKEGVTGRGRYRGMLQNCCYSYRGVMVKLAIKVKP